MVNVRLVDSIIVVVLVFMGNESVVVRLECHDFGFLAGHSIHSFNKLWEILLLVHWCSVLLLSKIFLTHLLKIMPSLVFVMVSRKWSLKISLFCVLLLILLIRCLVVRESIKTLGLTMNRMLQLWLSLLLASETCRLEASSLVNPTAVLQMFELLLSVTVWRGCYRWIF